MFKKLLAAISIGVFALSTATVAAQTGIPGSPSEGALGNWTDGDPAYTGKAVKPKNVPASQFEGALGTAVSHGQPMFQGTSAGQPTSIPESPSEGVIR